MKLPDFIALAHVEPALEFVLIGGYAVAALGHARATFDVDFMIRRSEATLWKSRLLGAGLVLHSEGPNFAQFLQPSRDDGLDLMMVDERTFGLILATASEAEVDGARTRLPSLDNLLALKLHVLRQALPHRTGKDAEDVEMLLRRNNVPLETDHYRGLFLKYGNSQLYETFVRILRHE